MAKPDLLRAAVILGMFAYAAAVLAYDLSQPLGVAAAVPHVGIVLLALALPGKAPMFVAAAAASVLTLGKVALHWDGEVPDAAMINRGLTLLVLWGTAWALATYRARAEKAAAEVVERRAREAQAKMSLKARESELRRVRELDAVAAGISHHFNNVLASALSLADSLPDATPEQAETVSGLQGVLWRAVELVRELRHCIEDSPEDLEFADLAPLVRQAAAQIVCPDKVAVAVVGNEEVELPVRRLELTRSLEVVCTNAVDAVGPAGGTVTVSWETCGPPAADVQPRVWINEIPATADRFVCLRVTDMGEGMDDGALSRLGEPFFTTKGPSRLGLGMVRARTTMTRHGGGMAVTSAPGQGTSVEFWLPLEGAKGGIDPLIALA